MADLVKALRGKASIDIVAAVLILIGGLLMIGGCVYRVFVRPEWTTHEAIIALWPFLAAGAVSFAVGWLIDRAESSHRVVRVRRLQPEARRQRPSA
jgi:hypothetical protein